MMGVNDEQKTLKFPEGLIGWAGHREGGVRSPFQQGTGRPCGVQLDTPLVLRLKNWVGGLVAGKDVPRAILLVGGPGNGKSDAVEGLLEFLDAELGASGSLIEKFAAVYKVKEKEHSPRNAVVDLSTLPLEVPAHLQTSFSLVQDATEGDSSQGARAPELLLKELAAILNADRRGIYVCCVNRGILANAATIAHESANYSEVTGLITQIVRSVTSGPTAPACWPLKDYEHIGVWPMDVESLVATHFDSDVKSVAHQIFQVALDESKWSEPCDLKTRCPFCQNRRILTRKGALDALIRTLYYYELSSGKRWTFRDLFSLVPHLLVGDSAELEIRGKHYGPCAWAAEQHRLAQEGPLNSTERDRAPYLLASRLYHHRLFPRWPRFDSGDHRTAKIELFKERYSDPGILAARALFRFAARNEAASSRIEADVPKRIRNMVGPALDPALATGGGVLFSREGRDYTIADVEDNFSLSIRTGLDLVGTQVEVLERDLLEKLALADESLVEDRFPRNRTRQARLLQSTIRQFAARLTKRSLGTRKGVCRDVHHYVRYLETSTGAGAQNEVRKELRNLLHNDNNKFLAGLATTFGQPVAERSRDVSLILPKMVTVQPVKAASSDMRPKDPLPYLKVEGHYVAMTFEFFRALEEVSVGLHEASLPTEIYSLLDRVKSLVAGQVVRDEEVLGNEPQIMLGSSLDTIEYVAGEFHFSKGDRP